MSELPIDPAIEAGMKRILDRFAAIVGDEMVRKSSDPKPLDKVPTFKPPPSKKNTAVVGTKTIEVLTFCKLRLAGNNPFPTPDEICTHMKWTGPTATMLAKSSVRRLVKAGFLSSDDVKRPKPSFTP